MWKGVAPSQCSRTLPMNATIGSAHCDCERNSCKDCVWSKMCGTHSWIWSKAEHCIQVWHWDSRTCFRQSVHIRPLSSLVPQHPVSHHNVCEVSRVEEWFGWQTPGWALTHVLMCTIFPFGEVYGFVVRCNMCSIMCEMWASTFSPCHDTFVDRPWSCIMLVDRHWLVIKVALKYVTHYGTCVWTVISSTILFKDVYLVHVMGKEMPNIDISLTLSVAKPILVVISQVWACHC